MWSLGAHWMDRLSKTNAEQEEYLRNMDQMELHWQYAKNVTTTCSKSHRATQTKFAPRKFCFNATMDGTNNYWGPYDKQYHLR